MAVASATGLEHSWELATAQEWALELAQASAAVLATQLG